MADNLNVNPFSSADEGIDFPLMARLRVLETYNKTHRNNPMTRDETYVVLFAYILGGWKATVSTSRPDGRYYEVTYNKSKGETYVDVYQKVDQALYPDVEMP